MLLYKYRSNDDKCLERDLKLLSNNKFYASKIEDLNDEKEFLFRREALDIQLDALTTLFHIKPDSANMVKKALSNLTETTKTCGVYSLSASSTIEPMWASYGSCSKGYCIMYDSDILKQTVDNVIKDQRFLLKVHYSDNIPSLNIMDMNDEGFLPKMMATKMETWDYEEEYRIVTNKSGEQKFLPSALKGIVFGSKASDDLKERIRQLLEDRDVDFYQIVSDDKSYDLSIKKIFSNHKHRLLDASTYSSVKHSVAISDTFSVKSHSELKDSDSIKDFMVKFKHDNAERDCNIFLYDTDTDLEKTNDDIKYGDYLNKHLIAVMYLGSDDVCIEDHD